MSICFTKMSSLRNNNNIINKEVVQCVEWDPSGSQRGSHSLYNGILLRVFDDVYLIVGQEVNGFVYWCDISNDYVK